MSRAAVTPPCPPREWIRISYMGLHPEPVFPAGLSLPDEGGDVPVGDLLAPEPGDDAVRLCPGRRTDGAGEDSSETEGVVPVDDHHLPPGEIQDREGPEPPDAHDSGSRSFVPEAVHRNLGLPREGTEGDNDHIRVLAQVLIRYPVPSLEPGREEIFCLGNDRPGIPHRSLH